MINKIKNDLLFDFIMVPYDSYINFINLILS